jgi:hypothetical protein
MSRPRARGADPRDRRALEDEIAVVPARAGLIRWKTLSVTG